MEIKPNLDNLSEEEFYDLVMKMLKGIGDSLDKTKEKLKNTCDYLENNSKLRDFYKKYNVNYYSKLN